MAIGMAAYPSLGTFNSVFYCIGPFVDPIASEQHKHTSSVTILRQEIVVEMEIQQRVERYWNFDFEKAAPSRDRDDTSTTSIELLDDTIHEFSLREVSLPLYHRRKYSDEISFGEEDAWWQENVMPPVGEDRTFVYFTLLIGFYFFVHSSFLSRGL